MGNVNIKQNQNIELSIVGCLLKDGTLIKDDSVSKLETSDFMYSNERIVFQIIKELDLSQKPIDTTTVINRLKEKEKLDDVGGAYYITGLLNDVTTTAHLPFYIDRDKFVNFVLKHLMLFVIAPLHYKIKHTYLKQIDLMLLLILVFQ